MRRRALSSDSTFDVQVQTKSGWKSKIRAQGLRDAKTEVRVLQATGRYDAVRIVQENFDFNTNDFARNTVFTETREEAQAREARQFGFADEAEERLAHYGDDDEFEEYGGFMSTRRDKYIAAGILSLVAIVIAAGIYMSRQWVVPIDDPNRSNYFVYDLPAIITNISHGERTYSVRVNLQLELDDEGDSAAVEYALGRITQSVIEHLQQADAVSLNQRNGLQDMREGIRRRIQYEMEETKLYGVLFKSIQVH